MKKYQKKKDKSQKSNTLGPKYRTPDHFKGKNFGASKKSHQVRFNPGQFKVQHKG
jgi:hypothetical protein